MLPLLGTSNANVALGDCLWLGSEAQPAIPQGARGIYKTAQHAILVQHMHSCNGKMHCVKQCLASRLAPSTSPQATCVFVLTEVLREVPLRSKRDAALSGQIYIPQLATCC